MPSSNACAEVRTPPPGGSISAVHLVVDGEPHLFRDTLAATLLGGQAGELIGYHRAHGDHVVLSGTRAQVTARAAYTERLLGDRFEQYVVLGAGLDTFALRRAPGGPPSRVIEVDHPATQRWKRDLMTAAGLASPDGLVFAPVDFESGDLMAALRAAGLDPERPALVSWLGVAMYLTEEAIAATLAVLGRLPRGSELVMEYALPPGLRDERGAEYASFALAAAADRGEPWPSPPAPRRPDACFTGPGDTGCPPLPQRHRLLLSVMDCLLFV
ncbi:class I SAM-dependent methyltransferase [Nonomuraea rubra]|uniref:class I SAM-dependent methyltransferase n=1 Tax=Nonomuraea rubra TaxID=46180 RepID=UPI003606F3CF